MGNDLHKWVRQLANRTILIIGDVILDEYLIGSTARLSREAPVPVLEFEERRLIAGGAANPASNIARLNSHAIQCGVIGADSYGEQLQQVLQEKHIQISGLIVDASRPTTVKTRIMAQMGLRFPQQVARIDTLSREPINAQVEGELLARVSELLPQADAVLFSDYHTGLLTPSLVEKVRALADEKQIIITADAQGDLHKYRGATLVKCNANEASIYLQTTLKSDEDFARAARQLCDELRLTGAMMITRGADGATLASASQQAIIHSPAPDVTDVFDTVGAGDTAIAIMTLATVAGVPWQEAMILANYASGIVVRRVGNYTPTPEELMKLIDASGS